jgi:hypothetical protein
MTFVNRALNVNSVDVIRRLQKDVCGDGPTGRHGTPEDVAGLVPYLLSDDSSYATGTAHSVDGGFTTACRIFWGTVGAQLTKERKFMAQRNWFMPDTGLQRQQNGTALLWKSWLMSAGGCSSPEPLDRRPATHPSPRRVPEMEREMIMSKCRDILRRTHRWNTRCG